MGEGDRDENARSGDENERSGDENESDEVTSRNDGTVFGHCLDESERWATFYSLACLCHPDQGGRREDMQALCAEARGALGAAWPAHWASATSDGRPASWVPNLFDVFCTATGVDNPFGQSIAKRGGQFGRVLEEPEPYRYGAAAYAPLAPALGTMELVFSCSAGDGDPSSAPRWSLT